MKKLTTEEFINRARAVHGDKYGYDEVVYVNARSKITIMCKKHGSFTQLPQHHMARQGCPKCGMLHRLVHNKDDKLSFIRKARSVHADMYYYDDVVYVDAKTKIIIRCKKHGVFTKSPSHHLAGQGCPKCARKEAGKRRRIGNDAFITRAVDVHTEKYTYEKTNYKGSHNKIAITCKKHGDFMQPPLAHLYGQGCPKCGREEAGKGRRIGNEEFITRAVDAHREKYTYEKTVYNGSKEKVIITCKKHGDFMQTPSNHLYGLTGCPKCATVISKGHAEVGAFLESILNG
jgi:Zn finger protein HypA/HybF involved in hydrogenase expression